MQHFCLPPVDNLLSWLFCGSDVMWCCCMLVAYSTLALLAALNAHATAGSHADLCRCADCKGSAMWAHVSPGLLTRLAATERD